jgi:hypothetical protein
LLDPDGKIIAKDLRGLALEAILAKLFEYCFQTDTHKKMPSENFSEGIFFLLLKEGRKSTKQSFLSKIGSFKK